MNESTNNPADDKTGIGETVTTALRQPSFLRVMLVLAATVVVLVGMRLGAPILNPILFAVVLALLFSPVYAWLRRRGIPTPLALVIMLVGLTRPLRGALLHPGRLDRQVQRGHRILHEAAERAAGQHREPDQEPGAFESQSSGRGEPQRPHRGHRRRPVRHRRLPEQPVLDPDDHAVLARGGTGHDEQAARQRGRGQPAGRQV